MRRFAHMLLVFAGFAVWSVMLVLAKIVVTIAAIGDWVYPDSTRGNCWSYALPKWRRHGGYLLIRTAEGQRMRVPHVQWVKSLDMVAQCWEDCGRDPIISLEHLQPIKRHASEDFPWWSISRWVPWYVIYWQGAVKTTDSARVGKEN